MPATCVLILHSWITHILFRKLLVSFMMLVSYLSGSLRGGCQRAGKRGTSRKFSQQGLKEVGGRQVGEDDTWRGKDEPGETCGGLEHRDAEGSPFRSRGSQRRQSVERNVLQGSSERCKMLVSLALC